MSDQWRGRTQVRRCTALDHECVIEVTSQSMHDHDVGRFDRWSSHYNRSIFQKVFFNPVQRATLDAAAQHANEVTTVLDVGCGTGQLLRRAADRFPDAELVGIDPAPGMVRQAQAAVPSNGHFEFLNASAENLPFPDASFDLVLTTMSFHHWADQEHSLHEVRRVLRVGALLVITDMTAQGWLGMFLPLRRGHARAHPPDVLDQMLASARLLTVRRASVPWLRQIKITLAHAVE